MFAFELEEFIVPAAIPVWILAAYIRTSLVDCATTFVRIEEATDALVNMITLMAQDLFVSFSGLVVICKTLLCLCDRQIEVPGQTGDVVIADRDACVAAAIAGTLGAIESGFGSETHEGMTLCRVT
jgi:hypothetical protein